MNDTDGINHYREGEMPRFVWLAFHLSASLITGIMTAKIRKNAIVFSKVMRSIYKGFPEGLRPCGSGAARIGGQRAGRS